VSIILRVLMGGNRWAVASRRFAGAALAALVALLPVVAFADSSIQQLVAKTLTPRPGEPATFEIGITSSDTTIWDPASYTVQLVATDPSGAPVVSTDPVPGEDPAIPGQTTIVFLTLTIPASYTGPVNVIARLKHRNSVDESIPIGIVVGGTAVAAAPPVVPAPPGQPPAPGATPVPGATAIPGQPGIPGQPPEQAPPGPEASPAAAPAASPQVAQSAPAASPPAKKFTGTLASNETYATQGTQSGTLNLSGSLGPNDSFTTTAGLATTPGGNKPLVGIQTQYALTQVGTFSPSFDKDVFAGPSGTGVSIKRTWGDVHSLQFALISGNHATTNPYEMEGLSYDFPVLNNPFEVTGGFETVDGPTQQGAFFLRSGRFLGLGWDAKAPHSSLTYSIHYGMVDYLDDLTNTERADRVFDLALGFMLRKAQFSFGYVRAGPYYADASAPGVTPDKESETASVTVPVGVFQTTLSASGYRDDLPGSTLQQQTHFWTESAGITYPFKNGDSLALQSSNGVQHQTGDPIAPFSGNDNTSLAYTTKRGPYAIQYTLTSTNQRDNGGHLMHVISDALNVSRAPFAGVTLTTGFNLTHNEANVEQSTGLNSSATASVSYTKGALTFSTQVNHALAHPFVGLSTPPMTTYNYGLTMKPASSPYSVSATVTQNVGGSANSSNGALSVNRAF
jgi:hypothetical protein